MKKIKVHDSIVYEYETCVLKEPMERVNVARYTLEEVTHMVKVGEEFKKFLDDCRAKGDIFVEVVDEPKIPCDVPDSNDDEILQFLKGIGVDVKDVTVKTISLDVPSDVQKDVEDRKKLEQESMGVAGSTVHPDVEQTWKEIWEPILYKSTVADGTLVINLNQLKKELHDYRIMMDNVKRVYSYISGGAIDTALIRADEIIRILKSKGI